MKGPSFLKGVLRKRVAQFAQLLKPKRLNLTEKQFQDLRNYSRRLYGFLCLFESSFSKGTFEETKELIERMFSILEEERKRAVFVFILERLVKGEGPVSVEGGVQKKRRDANRQLIHHSRVNDISEETRALKESSVREALKQLKRVNARNIEKELVRNFKPVQFAVDVLVKMLNGKRQELFNQIVEIIRASRKEDLDCLQVMVEQFSSLLQLAVEFGYEKGRRLLRISKVLNLRLVQVQDEEKFGSYLEALERERASSTDKIESIQELRAVRNRLGILQAHTLQALHAHLPLSLQVLKRQMVY